METINPVQRIGRKSLEKILDGAVQDSHLVMIKFYGADCYLCHGLAPIYKELASSYEDVLFYAFNMQDDGGQWVEEKYGFEGTPSICLVQTEGVNTMVKFLKEPEKPDRETWYYKDDIIKFIERYR
tara:strand:- start:684 stop:1061 length:378 start_codon:yes stop_codon:yes gene_type:complete